VDTVHECDRQTDGQTDRITITKTVQRITSHGNNAPNSISADPAGGAHSAPQTPQLYLRGPTSKGREGKGKGGEREGGKWRGKIIKIVAKRHRILKLKCTEFISAGTPPDRLAGFKGSYF